MNLNPDKWEIPIVIPGLQIIFLPWKDICPTRALFWWDKRKIWSDINIKVHSKELCIRKSNFIGKWYSQMLQQKIGRTKCLTKVAISSDIGKFWLAIVRWPTVICSPEYLYAFNTIKIWVNSSCTLLCADPKAT